MKVRLLNLDRYATLQEVGDIVEATYDKGFNHYVCTVKTPYGIDYLGFYANEVSVIIDEPQKDEHYNNENGSLYLFAQQHNLNAWEFDILKRVVRCRKKGQFKEDLEKTKRVIDLYLKEFEA